MWNWLTKRFLYPDKTPDTRVKLLEERVKALEDTSLLLSSELGKLKSTLARLAGTLGAKVKGEGTSLLYGKPVLRETETHIIFADGTYKQK